MLLLFAALSALLVSADPIVFTQTPKAGPSRIAVLAQDGSVNILSKDFYAAADPEVYFDGTKILFAAQRQKSDRWQIFEMNADGSGVHQITQGSLDCRQPVYQSRVFTLDEPKPWDQVAYVSGGSLHSVKLDGSEHQQLTYTATEDSHPLVLPDGRMIYASQGKLFGVNLDGTDYGLFAPVNGRGAAVTDDGGVVVAEAGKLAWLSQDRPLHSYRALTAATDGIFQTPSWLPGGAVLAARKTNGTFSLVRFDPTTRKAAQVFGSPEFDSTQPKVLRARPLPDGRGSVVEPKDPTATLYCLSAFTTDQPAVVNAKSAKIVRIVAGTAAQPKTLGEAPLEDDGSFHLTIPANTPVRVQLLDAKGALLRSSSWIWARNREKRGCIGCHEDRELSPENREAKAVIKKAVPMPTHTGVTK